MPNAIQQQDMSVLSAAKQGLVYLTANDWALIADKSSRVQFKAGEPIVQRGKRTHGVFLLLKGTASVQISALASPAIGPGEVCGEISFLDELPATANVIAQEAVEAYYLDRPTLQSLFELFPHLGSRFYHSLASSLSRRLRDLLGAGAAPGKKDAEGKEQAQAQKPLTAKVADKSR
jgi:CRP-like cAMP-binding protein